MRYFILLDVVFTAWAGLLNCKKCEGGIAAAKLLKQELSLIIKHVGKFVFTSRDN